MSEALVFPLNGGITGLIFHATRFRGTSIKLGVLVSRSLDFAVNERGGPPRPNFVKAKILPAMVFEH